MFLPYNCIHDILTPMSAKHSLAMIARWSKSSKEERSKRMSHAVKSRWEKMSKEDRSKYALMMVEAKKNKKLLVNKNKE